MLLKIMNTNESKFEKEINGNSNNNNYFCKQL